MILNDKQIKKLVEEKDLKEIKYLLILTLKNLVLEIIEDLKTQSQQ